MSDHKILKFRIRDDKGVRATLEEAIDLNLDEVVVVGIKGGELHSCKSAHTSTITWLGCLDYFRIYLYNKLSGLE